MSANNVPTIIHPTNRPNYSVLSTPTYNIYYSYETPIGFSTRTRRVVASAPESADSPGATPSGKWGPTTARHVALASADGAAERLTWDEFVAVLDEVTR